MLNEIELKNFRGFSDLKLSGLGRVNLVVGLNNTGKTTFLEAISLLGNQRIENFHLIYRETPNNLKHLFYSLLLSEGNVDKACEIIGKTISRDVYHLTIRSQNSRTPYHHPKGEFANRTQHNQGSVILMNYASGDHLTTQTATSLQGTEAERISKLSKILASGEDEDQMIRLLQAVDGRIQAVRILADYGNSYIAVGFDRKNRVPISQVGQGVGRLIAIFSEILGSKANICCIDELENGLHYTTLPKIWKGIAEVAERLDVQIFVTTHSHECLVAAHETFAERASYDLRVIQLYRMEDRTEGRVLDREHIEAALAAEIELR